MHGVDALLVSGVSAAGLVIGGALDPWGQRMAERSRLDAERRRAEIEAFIPRYPTKQAALLPTLWRSDKGGLLALVVAYLDDWLGMARNFFSPDRVKRTEARALFGMICVATVPLKSMR